MTWLILAAGPAALGIWWLRGLLRRRRRERLRHQPLAPEQRRVLARCVPLATRLPRTLTAEYEGRIQIFLDEKRFFGEQGLAISDDIRLTIAGYACLLLCGRWQLAFENFTTILVYPTTFMVDVEHSDGTVAWTERVARAGESWHRGPVIVSWSDIEDDLAHDDGGNVVLHEFAHKLDEADGAVDGVPLLDRAARTDQWIDVLQDAFDGHQAEVAARRATLLDEYGAESPAEFFAVATETFFEQPADLRARHPALYAELERYYGVDPATWTEADSGPR